MNDQIVRDISQKIVSRFAPWLNIAVVIAGPGDIKFVPLMPTETCADKALVKLVCQEIDYRTKTAIKED